MRTGRALPGAVQVAACIALIATLPACSGSPSGELSPTADLRADAPGDPIEAHRNLLKALQEADVETLTSLLDPSVDLRIFHPSLVSRIDGIDEARSGFVRMFHLVGAAEWTEVHVAVTQQDRVAWFTYHFAVESPNAAEPFLGRATEIWVRRADGWKLTHGHWSGDPEGV